MSGACPTCDNTPHSEGYGDFGDGWVAAMQFAHHAHAEHTYNGHMSANGVLGAGPDAVIVDGDYLAMLESRARRLLPRLDVRFRHWRRRTAANVTYALRRLRCVVTSHSFRVFEYGLGTWCERCGMSVKADR